MSFLVRLHRRFLVPCADAYLAGPFLPLPLAYFLGFLVTDHTPVSE
jgi:hypothetical protein